MAEPPARVKAVWATRQRRLLLSVGVPRGGGVDARVGVPAPRAVLPTPAVDARVRGGALLVIMFGLQAVEAIGDLVGKRDSVPSSTASDGG